MNIYSYVGVVERGELSLLLAEDNSTGPCQLTSAAKAAAFEAGRMEIGGSDGLVLLVRGIREGGWIRSAVVVETASPLASVVAQAAFGRKPRFSQG